MAGLALSGLASGVDTSSIVEQLIALDRQGTTRIQNRQYGVTGLQTTLKAVATKLAALKTAATALSSDATWKPQQTVESSDTKVVVSQTGGAGIGGHTLQVNRLASSMQRGYSFTGGTAGTITITSNADSANTMQISVGADATLQQIADSINAKATGPVVAAVVNNGTTNERLVMSSRTTGSESDFTVSRAACPATTRRTRRPTSPSSTPSYSLDGGAAVGSKSNVLENVIPGLRITLKGVTAAPADINVSEPVLDRDAVKKKITDFVNAYNAVVDPTRRGDHREARHELRRARRTRPWARSTATPACSRCSTRCAGR